MQVVWCRGEGGIDLSLLNPNFDERLLGGIPAKYRVLS